MLSGGLFFFLLLLLHSKLAVVYLDPAVHHACCLALQWYFHDVRRAKTQRRLEILVARGGGGGEGRGGGGLAWKWSLIKCSILQRVKKNEPLWHKWEGGGECTPNLWNMHCSPHSSDFFIARAVSPSDVCVCVCVLQDVWGIPDARLYFTSSEICEAFIIFSTSVAVKPEWLGPVCSGPEGHTRLALSVFIWFFF